MGAERVLSHGPTPPRRPGRRRPALGPLCGGGSTSSPSPAPRGTRRRSWGRPRWVCRYRSLRPDRSSGRADAGTPSRTARPAERDVAASASGAPPCGRRGYGLHAPPQIQAGPGPVRAPRLTHLGQGGGVRDAAEAVRAHGGGADDEVTPGQYVRPVQGEDQEHAGGPLTDALDGHQRLRGLVVAEFAEPVQIEIARHDVLG